MPRTVLFALGMCVLTLSAGCEDSSMNGQAQPTLETIDLARFQGENNVLILFDRRASSPDVQQQTENLADYTMEMIDHDLVTMLLVDRGKGAFAGKPVSPKVTRTLRNRFGLTDDRFAVILLGKAGQVLDIWKQPVEAPRILAEIDQR
jgi:hypothetical protein